MAKYQKYTEYKDSAIKEIGVIPKHWDISKVKFLAKCLDGQRIPLNGTERGERSGTVPYWGANKIVDYVNDWIFDEELVLLGEDGAPFFDTTKDVAFAINGKIWPNNHVHVLRPNRLKVGIKYLTYSLNCTDYSLYISGSTRDKLNQSDMDNILIRMPSLIEQTQIANFLDHETAKIDHLIEKQQQLIELLKEKRQAVISHAVTKGLDPNVPMKDSGVEWLGEVPEHWETLPLKLCVETRKGVAFKAVDFCDSGIRVVKASDIKQKTIRESEVFLPDSYINEYPKAVLYTGDLVLSTVGSTPDVKNSAVGQIGKVPESLNGSLLNQNTVVFSANKLLDQGFLFYLVQTNSYRDHLDLNAHGTANQASLNISDMLDFIIPMPETNEQIQITHYLDNKIAKLEELEAKSASMISYLTERRTALISAAVTGKIDVRNWQAPSVTEADTELSA